MTITQADKKNKAAIFKGRKAHLAYQGVSEKQLWRTYKKAAGKIGTKIMLENTLVPKAKLRALLNSVENEIKRLDSKVLSTITTSINKSVKMGIDNSIDRLTIYKGFMPATFAIELTSSVFNSIYHDAVRALYRRPLDGIELSERVWNIHKTSITQIRRIIARGFLYGEPSYSIAQQVRRMLLISESDMRTKKWKLFFKENPPGRGVYKSAYKNTERVIRTEMNNAFRIAQSEYAASRAWIIGEKWHRVAGAVECAECDTYASQDLYGLGSGVYPGGEIPMSHPQCYSYDTEVMTSNGFKLFNNVNKNDLIMSFNPKTKQMEYVEWVSKIEYFHKGEMVHLKHRGIDCLVTLNHRMLISSWNRKKYIFKDAIDLIDKPIFFIPRTGEWKGEKTNKRQQNIAKIWGWIISEGHITNRGIENYQLTICQEKKNNRKRIKQILSSIGINKYCETTTGFIIHGWLAKDVFNANIGLSYERRIPDFIKKADTEAIKAFLNEFISGDGSTRNMNCYGCKSTEKIYYTSSPQLRDDLSELILKSGKTARITIHVPKGTKTKHYNGEYINKHDCWSIRESKSNHIRFSPKNNSQIQLECYENMVYCLELEKNHVLCFRRNGYMGWGGNCLCFLTDVIRRDILKSGASVNVI